MEIFIRNLEFSRCRRTLGLLHHWWFIVKAQDLHNIVMVELIKITSTYCDCTSHMLIRRV